MPIDPDVPTGWQTWAKTAQIGLELTTHQVGPAPGSWALTCITSTCRSTAAAKASGSLTDVRCHGPHVKHNDILVSTLGRPRPACHVAGSS